MKICSFRYIIICKAVLFYYQHWCLTVQDWVSGRSQLLFPALYQHNPLCQDSTYEKDWLVTLAVTQYLQWECLVVSAEIISLNFICTLSWIYKYYDFNFIYTCMICATCSENTSNSRISAGMPPSALWEYVANRSMRAMMIFLTLTPGCNSAHALRNECKVCRWNSSGNTYMTKQIFHLALNTILLFRYT